MCYYNGQKVTRAEFIQLKQLEKVVRNYDFLDVGVHNGFNYAPMAIAVASDDREGISKFNRRNGAMFPDTSKAGKKRQNSDGCIPP